MTQEPQVARASWMRPYALGFASAIALSISAYFAAPYAKEAATTAIHHLQEASQEVSYRAARIVLPHLSDQHKQALIPRLAVSEDAMVLAALSFESVSFYARYTSALSAPVEPLLKTCAKQYALASTDERALRTVELYSTLDDSTKTLVASSLLIESAAPITAISDALFHYNDATVNALEDIIEKEQTRRRFETAHDKGRDIFGKMQSYYHFGLDYLRKRLGGDL